MSSESPLPEPAKNVVLDTTNLPAPSSASVWERISKWVSDNKALVYTVAGVAVVVTSAGVVYYLSDSSKPSAKPAPSSTTEKKKSKNQRRKEKEKKKAEDEKKAKTSSAQDGSFFSFLFVYFGLETASCEFCVNSGAPGLIFFY